MHTQPARVTVAALAAAAAGLLTLTACGVGQSLEPTSAPPPATAPTSAPQAPSFPPPSTTGPETLTVGETAVFTARGSDVAEITVSNVEVYTTPRAAFAGAPPKNGAYVKFTVNVKYVGDGTVSYHVNPWNWSAKSSGRVYQSPAIFEPVASKLPATDLVNKGGQVTGEVVLDAPASGKLRLVPASGGFTGPKAFWTYGDPQQGV